MLLYHRKREARRKASFLGIIYTAANGGMEVYKNVENNSKKIIDTNPTSVFT
jgi:hypothetical protein